MSRPSFLLDFPTLSWYTHSVSFAMMKQSPARPPSSNTRRPLLLGAVSSGMIQQDDRRTLFRLEPHFV